MIIVAATWEDDQCGPMMQDVEQVNFIEDVTRIQDQMCYCFYKTDLPFEQARDILNQEEYEYGGDASSEGMAYLYVGWDCEPYDQEEMNQRKEAEKILMSKSNVEPVLKRSHQEKDFHLVSERDWKSLKDCNMLIFFYPFCQGISHAADLAMYNGLRKQKEQVKKPLSELTESEYKTLESIGALAIAYPEATGDYREDVDTKFTVNITVELEQEQLRCAGLAHGLQNDNARNPLSEFMKQNTRVAIQYEVDSYDGSATIIAVNDRKLVD